MDKYNLDAIVSPTDSPAWMTDLVDGDHFLGGSSQLAAVAGYPAYYCSGGICVWSANWNFFLRKSVE